MACPACASDNPEAARFCHRCGRSLRGDTERPGRADAYVVQPGENLRQVALISTIMPHSNREGADNYRWALLVGGILVLGLTLLGILPAAVVAAAALVPVVYLVYVYDVNLWEDAPLRVVLSLFVLTGVLATLVSLVFFRWIFDSEYLSLVVTRSGISGRSIIGLLIFALLLPVIAEVVKNLGAVWLAGKPAYDDMIDGLTFGVAAGTAYAAFETLVAQSPVFTSGQLRTTTGLAGWLVVILNLVVVKSVIYGTATGIAVASYSGLGEGYDGFTPTYVKNFLYAAGANVVYWLGVRLLGFLPFGQALGLLWGVVVAGFLILRVRAFLQSALLEAALEDAANDRRPKGATTGGGFCPECEMPLLPDSMFCVACGASLRAASSQSRHHTREAVGSEPGGAA